MKLSEAREKFKDEWMAFEQKDESGDPEGEVLCHHSNREVFDKQWPKFKVDGLYITFNGPVAPPGHVIMFLAA